MYLKFTIFQIIFTILLLNKLISAQPITKEEEEEHLNNRLQHYQKHIELIMKKSNVKFQTELQTLMEKLKYSLAHESFKDKVELLENPTKLQDFSEYLAVELDKQHINQDILIETWYLNEILSHLNKELYDETLQVLDNLKAVYRTEDLEEKFNIYTDIGEKLTEQFLDYFFGEDEPLPLLNAQLKYYYEYISYLLQEFKNINEEFHIKLHDLSKQVVVALASDDEVVKAKIIQYFNDVTTKFGRFLDEHFIDFKMFKFGE